MPYSDKQKQTIQLLQRNTEVTDVFYGGGAGSGKTFLGCDWQISRRLLYPGTRGFMGRNTFSDFKVTTLKTFIEVWNTRWQNNPFGTKININLHEKQVTFSNGSEILIKDLSYNSSDPEFNTLGGMELTDAFIDEVPEITQKAKDIVRSRIRYKLINRKPCLLMTGNPTNNWVKAEFVEDKNGVPVILPNYKAFVPALLKDNPNPEFVEDYQKQLMNQSVYDRERLLFGNWSAVETVDNPFMYAWDDKYITTALGDDGAINTNLPYIVSIDFNLNPFCGIIAQINGKELHVLDEFAIDNGSITKLVQHLEYFGNRHLMRITGDAMGNQRSIEQADHSSLYIQIKKGLQLRDAAFFITSNPRHENSRADCNKLIHSGLIKIHPRCKGLLNDMRQVEADAHGKIIKSNRNKMNQRADHLDALRYICHNFMRKFL